MNTTNKKRIGIVGSISKEGIFGVGTAYMQFISMFGTPVILTPDSPVEKLDLLILRGGSDVSPSLQNSETTYKTGNSNPYLDLFYSSKLKQYIEKGVPIFGICRGLQELNLIFGGTLDEHIYHHPTNSWTDRDSLKHDVFKPSRINYNKGEFEVNSLHHQAVGDVADDFEVLLMSEEGIVEAFKHNTLPIQAVQWHPEEIIDEWSVDVINELLENA